jgi:hypothetical protein
MPKPLIVNGNSRERRAIASQQPVVACGVRPSGAFL